MIEHIVLSRDQRGMTALRPHLPADFCEGAARLVLDHPGRALVATGFYIPSGGAPETDGPPGAVALGRALAAIGYGVSYVTDGFTAPLLRGIAGPSAAVHEMAMAGHEESRGLAAAILAEASPDVLVAVERCGLTEDGAYLNMRGADVSSYHAKLDYLFTDHPCSVGIGDGGNEIGMGILAPEIRLAGVSGRPCVTRTTRLVVSSVSNWGAWGLVAALSRQSGRNLLPSVSDARDLLDQAVDLGAVDGVSGRREASVDGFPAAENDRVLGEMHAWLARHLVTADRPVSRQ